MPLLSGHDQWDATMVPVPLGDPAAVQIGKLRVAYYTTNGIMDPTPETQALVKQCVGYFQKAGCKVRDDKPPKMAELAVIRNKFNGADGREHIRRLLRVHGTSQASPGLNLSGDVVSSADFTRLSEEMDAIRSEQLAWFEQYDLIVCPANQRAPIRLDFEQPQEVRQRSSYTSQYNTTGWPAGVVRAGTFTDEPGQPLGIQLVAQPWRDDVVIAAMAHVEKQTGGWVPPAI